MKKEILSRNIFVIIVSFSIETKRQKQEKIISLYNQLVLTLLENLSKNKLQE